MWTIAIAARHLHLVRVHGSIYHSRLYVVFNNREKARHDLHNLPLTVSYGDSPASMWERDKERGGFLLVPLLAN